MDVRGRHAPTRCAGRVPWLSAIVTPLQAAPAATSRSPGTARFSQMKAAAITYVADVDRHQQRARSALDPLQDDQLQHQGGHGQPAARSLTVEQPRQPAAEKHRAERGDDRGGEDEHGGS